MSTWHPALYAHWYVVARVRDVGSTPLAVTVLDTHVAVARTRSGQWIALEDRCPHRQAPLSAGAVVGERIVCPYHGWSFEHDGRLVDVPGLAGAVPPVCVRAFPVRELDGFLWLRPSPTGEDAPNALMRATDPATRRFQWRTTWPANVVDAMENFLDPMHTHFIHAGLVRRHAKREAATATLHATASGFTVDYAGGPAQSGLLFRLFESERVAERAHFAAPGTARIEYVYANGSRVLIDLHFTPRSAQATDVSVALHVEGRWAPAWAVRLVAWPFLRRVNDQDHAMLKLQAMNKARHGVRANASTPLDIVRGLLERFWSDGQLPQAADDRSVEMLL